MTLPKKIDSTIQSYIDTHPSLYKDEGLALASTQSDYSSSFLVSPRPYNLQRHADVHHAVHVDALCRTHQSSTHLYHTAIRNTPDLLSWYPIQHTQTQSTAGMMGLSTQPSLYTPATLHATQSCLTHLIDTHKISQRHDVHHYDYQTGTLVPYHQISWKSENITRYSIVCFIEGKKHNFPIQTHDPILLAGAVAIVIHPKNKLYKRYIERETRVIVPFFNISIPLVMDEMQEDVDGIRLLTPAHNHKDYQFALDHDLPYDHYAYTKHGMMTAHTKSFAGKPMDAIRDNIIQFLHDIGNIEKTYIQTTLVGYDSVSKHKVVPILHHSHYIYTGDRSLLDTTLAGRSIGSGWTEEYDQAYLQESRRCIGEDESGYMRFPLAIQDGQSIAYYSQQSYRSCLYTLVYDLYCAGIVSSHTGIYTYVRDALLYILPGEMTPYSMNLLQSYMTQDHIPDHEITELIRLVTAMISGDSPDIYDMFCEVLEKDTSLTQGGDIYRLWSSTEIVSVMHCDMYFLQMAQTAWTIRMSARDQTQVSTYIGLLVHPSDIYATKNILYILSMCKAPGQSYIYEYFLAVDTYSALTQTNSSIMQTYGGDMYRALLLSGSTGSAYYLTSQKLRNLLRYVVLASSSTQTLTQCISTISSQANHPLLDERLLSYTMSIVSDYAFYHKKNTYRDLYTTVPYRIMRGLDVLIHTCKQTNHTISPQIATIVSYILQTLLTPLCPGLMGLCRNILPAECGIEIYTICDTLQSVAKNHAFHHQIEMMMHIKQSVMRLTDAGKTFALHCAVTKPFAIQLEKQQDVIVSYCQIESISYTHELDILVWDDYVDIVRIMQHTIGLAQIQQIRAIDPSIPSADQLQSQEKIVGAIAYKTQLMQALRNTLVRSRATATRDIIAQQEQKITYLKMEIDALQTELSKMRYLG